MDLAGRACIVTGATKGIGRAIAEALATAGADVVVSARTAGDVERVAAELDGSGSGRVLGVPADVSRSDECGRLIGAAVQELDRLDVLVNNAGVGSSAPSRSSPSTTGRPRSTPTFGGCSAVRRRRFRI